MIPSGNSILTTDIEVEEESSKNYKMFLDEKFIIGKVDGLETMKQVIYKILNTETSDLYGEPVSYVCPEIERRITEALKQDDRIESVDSFEFDYSEKGILHVTFCVHTIYGDIQEERAVNY